MMTSRTSLLPATPLKLLVTVWLGILSSIQARQWPLRASNKDHVPASFDCEMRKAAYAYGKKLIPRHGKFEALYWALDLKHCNVDLSKDEHGELLTRDGTATSRRHLKRKGHEEIASIPPDAVFVAVDGTDDDVDSGTLSSPFQSLQKAVDYAATHTSSKHVRVREGVFYLNQTLLLTPQHSGLQILAYPGESPTFSGGIPLQIINEWKPYHPPNNKNKTNIWVTSLGNQLDGEMPGLQINGVRSTVARYPNMDGGIEVSCGYGCMIPGNQATWDPPKNANKQKQKVVHYTDSNKTRARPNGGWFEHYTIGVHGPCDVYDPPVSYWCSEHPSGGGAFAFITPSGMTPKDAAVLPNGPYYSDQSMQEDARIFVWRPARWANWMFRVGAYNNQTQHVTFGAGGNQGARGEKQGGDWFIENLLEELDSPNEFYYDPRTHKLYLWYNGTGAPPPDTEMVVPQLRTLVNATGTQWNPVVNITLRGITFRATRYTYMDPHGVPSGGDWALERNGAVFLQGTRQMTLDQCTFERLDSNGVMISGYNRNTTVQNCDFAYIGGTAMASWGYTNETDTDPGRPGVHLQGAPAAGVDGTDGEHPKYNTIQGCTAREVGLYEKQASFYMQAKTAYSTLTGNVFFNGPRAGINFNDGFAGGDELYHNLVFSTCRESGDHGPFNSWDRQPFLTYKDGLEEPTMFSEWRRIHHNFFIDNYSPQENVDNDDGSARFHTHDNFFVYGGQGMKNDFGGCDNWHYRNIYAYVGKAIFSMKQIKGHEDHFFENRVIMTQENVGSFQCDGDGAFVFGNNSYYTASGNVTECKMSLEEWQRHGNDLNSTSSEYPKDDEIIHWAKSLLGF
ncbi:expressed unknown protein [Seminavis robusta]|uniref:Right handed beta helix domain-containing protein n=1 Tax=Seminavis robusta TaxID=568900 RepID=A0A9N8EA86_9STRA|nr:expressed unknown protein [Seminavis robusta]|eukprot:Sro873_g214100.1 n/a (847) ;mRNA; f:39390-42053